MRARFAAVLMFLGTTAATLAGPLAHSHNDYEQTRPLYDALAQRFDSIEADVWLVDGKLLVAHERDQIHASRSLESLYLDPLRAVVRHGEPRSLILLIDVKTEAASTWRAIEKAVERYPELAVYGRFILSGNRARELMAAESQRRVALDGRMEDLDGDTPANFIPLISDNWAKFFTWRGEGELPAAERERLKGFVARAHAQGRLLRFWNTPDNPAMWRVLRECGVDVIGTDHLVELRRFLDQT